MGKRVIRTTWRQRGVSHETEFTFVPCPSWSSTCANLLPIAFSGTQFDEQPQDGLSNKQADEEIETPVLVVGGGPVGMLLAYTLSAYHGISCVLAEQSPTTTKYPKMASITRLEPPQREE
jgi:hypothetical protein